MEQKVFQIGGAKVGGQPGENPPLMIANMFQKGDKIIESRKERKFDREKAKEYISELETLSQQTGVPALVALVANSADEMKTYVDFYVSQTSMPFAIDMWVAQPRLEAARYVAELGLQNRLLYNSITPWDKDIDGQVAELKELGIKHVVVQAFDMTDQRASGRVTSLRTLLKSITPGQFASILVDTSVMNLPATAFSLLANFKIKEQFGLPVGCAPSNGIYMWKRSLELWGHEGFAAVDAAIHAISAALWSNFMLYGPITGSKRVFPAVAAATSVLSTLAYDSGCALPERDSHPLNLFFGDFVAKLKG